MHCQPSRPLTPHSRLQPAPDKSIPSSSRGSERIHPRCGVPLALSGVEGSQERNGAGCPPPPPIRVGVPLVGTLPATHAKTCMPQNRTILLLPSTELKATVIPMPREESGAGSLLPSTELEAEVGAEAPTSASVLLSPSPLKALRACPVPRYGGEGDQGGKGSLGGTGGYPPKSRTFALDTPVRQYYHTLRPIEH